MMNRNKLESSAVFFHSVYFGRSIKAFCADNDPCVFSADEIRRMVIDILPQYNSQQLNDRIKKFIGYFAEKTLSKSFTVKTSILPTGRICLFTSLFF